MEQEPTSEPRKEQGSEQEGQGAGDEITERLRKAVKAAESGEGRGISSLEFNEQQREGNQDQDD